MKLQLVFIFGGGWIKNFKENHTKFFLHKQLLVPTLTVFDFTRKKAF